MDKNDRDQSPTGGWLEERRHSATIARLVFLEDEIMLLRAAIGQTLTNSLKATAASNLPPGPGRQAAFEEIHALNQRLFELLSPRRPIGSYRAPSEDEE